MSMANEVMKVVFAVLDVSFNSGYYTVIIKRQFLYINYIEECITSSGLQSTESTCPQGLPNPGLTLTRPSSNELTRGDLTATLRSSSQNHGAVHAFIISRIDYGISVLHSDSAVHPSQNAERTQCSGKSKGSIASLLAFATFCTVRYFSGG